MTRHVPVRASRQRFAGIAAVLLTVAALAFVRAAGSGIDVDLDTRALEEVLRFARSRNDRAFADTHARYRLQVGGPKIDRVEVITEYRRAMMLAQARIAQGDFTWTVPDLERALQPFRGLVTITATVRLPPQNVLVDVPEYAGFLTQDPIPTLQSDAVRPARFEVQPMYPPGFTGPGSPIQGARMEMEFTIRSIDPNGRYMLGIFEAREPLTPVPLDFSKYR